MKLRYIVRSSLNFSLVNWTSWIWELLVLKLFQWSISQESLDCYGFNTYIIFLAIIFLISYWSFGPIHCETYWSEAFLGSLRTTRRPLTAYSEIPVSIKVHVAKLNDNCCKMHNSHPIFGIAIWKEYIMIFIPSLSSSSSSCSSLRRWRRIVAPSGKFLKMSSSTSKLSQVTLFTSPLSRASFLQAVKYKYQYKLIIN